MPQYKVPIKLRNQVKEKLDEHLRSGIIERSTSPWNLPMIARQKKNGDIRLVLDATAINSRTKKIDYPIFRIDETFTKLQGKEWFSNIDLRHGYHQVLLTPESRRYFAFKTDCGKFQYRRMPMGAANSGIYFQMVMETLLRNLIGESLIVYQDDILIATNTVDEHLVILSEVLKIFANENIQINNDKSKFLVQEVNFLGHVLKNGTFTPSDDNLEALLLLDPPNTMKQLRSFLGKLNFYARFLPALSHVTAPLTDLLSNNKTKLNWGVVHDDAFRKIQVILSTRPILHYPDYREKFIITIQVSNSALIGMVEQGQEGERYPIGYYSKKFNKAQRNYSVLEKHALAVVSVLEHFHHLIVGYEVDVHSERRAIEYLRGLKDGNSRTTDWITKIAKYSPNYVYDKNSNTIISILNMKEISEPEATLSLDERIPIAYTDGSCTGNGLPHAQTGIGIHWERCDLKDFSGHANSCSTNNKAELAAVIQALKLAVEAQFKKLIIVSDSKYVVDNVTKNMPTWVNNHWISSKNKPIENEAEFKCILQLLSSIQVEWRHTPGHANNDGNNKAHELALKGRLENITTNQEPTLIPSDGNNLSTNKDTPQVLAIRTKEVQVKKIITYETIKKEQDKDQNIKQFYQDHAICDQEPDYQEGIRLYKKGDLGIFAKGIIGIAPGKKVKVNAMYVPEGVRKEVISGVHESRWVNHAGYLTTCSILLENYFWSTFRRDVRESLRLCDVCQKNNPPRKKPEVMDFVKPTHPGNKIATDIIGPIVTSQEGYKYILTIVDMFTRYTVLCPMRSIRAEEVIDCLEKTYITVFGVPEYIITDRGSNFRSNIFQQACRVLKIKHYMSSPYHPATNGMVERLNKEVKRKLTTLCNNSGKSWASKIHLVQFSHNNSYHSSMGTTPNILTFGENRRFPEWQFYEAHPLELGTPEEYIDKLRKNLHEVREMSWEFEEATRKKRNEYINRNRVLPSYEIGDKVLYRTVKVGKTRKHGFGFLYDGPYEIKKCASKVSYDIGLEGDMGDKAVVKRVHVERLRPYYRATVIQDEPMETIISDNNKPKEAEVITIEESSDVAAQVQVVDDKEDIPPHDNIQPEELTVNPETFGDGDTINVEHPYNTRSKITRARRCYKHWRKENCGCRKEQNRK